MRTVLLSSVAALALSFATGSLAPAHAQAPATSTPMPAMAPPTATNPPPPDNAAPASSQPANAPPAGSEASTSEPGTTTAPKPVHHVRHVHHAVASTDAGAPDGHWAHQPGTGESGPASLKASNISAQDTHSDIAPHLPEPAVGPGASPEKYLKAAESALDKHRTGAAQQALEMAETRLLDRSTAVDAANQPDQGPAIAQITKARDALASGDLSAARSSIRLAMANAGTGGGDNGTAAETGTGQGTTSQGGTGPASPGAGQGAMGNPALGNNATGQGAVPASPSAK